MDNDFFLDAGIQPLLQLDQPSIPNWHSLPAVDLYFPVNGDDSSSCFYDSALSSMVSSPASAISNEGFVIRELLGKLGNICNSGKISPPAQIGNAVGSNLPGMPGDSGFADRAARLSSFRSRSFNCRTTQFGSPNGSGFNSSPGEEKLKAGRKLQRILSSPCLKVETENDMRVNRVDQGELRNSTENSLVGGAEYNCGSRKRKSKQIPSSPAKVTQNRNEPIAKRIKSNEEDDENPPKDYIHVRARRGQATDSHSLAERVRREKISERMKLLQDIVPGCNKVTGKALMLEEIINYVQSLQRQVEFLSMKVASVPPSIDFSTTNPFQHDMYQPNCSIQTSLMHQLDALAPTFYGAQHPLQQNGMSLPDTNGFINGVHQLQPLCEGDLNTIVEMGFSDKHTLHRMITRDQVKRN